MQPDGSENGERCPECNGTGIAQPPRPSLSAQVLYDFADRVEQAEPWLHKGAKFTKWAKDLAADLKIAALRDQTDRRLWHPIATAPRDKTRILLYADTTNNPAWPSNYVQFGYYERGKWHVENNGDYNYGGHGEDYETGPHSIDCPGYIHPTHWQAIPEPPK